jgi:hypothetical protein
MRWSNEGGSLNVACGSFVAISGTSPNSRHIPEHRKWFVQPPGAPLFFFTTRDDLRAAYPLMHDWRDGNGRSVQLI